MTQITVDHVSKVIGHTTILRDISFTVTKGTYVGIIGPNGAGKTTLLKILLGLDAPTDGTVTIAKGLRMGYVPQQYVLPDQVPISVDEVVAMGVARHRRDVHTRGAIMDALRHVGLPAAMCTQSFHTLSGGQKQRVLIARAIVTMPDILCVDEPLSGVDHASREQIRTFLSTINKTHGTTILFVSHDVVRITQSADIVLCLDKTLHKGCHPVGVASTTTALDCIVDDSSCTNCVPMHHHHND